MSCKIKMQISTYKINALAHVLYIGVPCSSLSLQKSENGWSRSWSYGYSSATPRRPTLRDSVFLIYKTGHGAGKTVQRFKAFALLAEDPDLGPSVHTVAHNHAEL